ncbi:unnamed protein product [Prunus armeniaca]
MAGSGMGELCAPIFNGSNYDFWRIKMCTIFKSHKLWDMVENGYEQPVKKEDVLKESAKKAYGKFCSKNSEEIRREYDSIAEVIEETKDTETIGVQECDSRDQPNTGQTKSSKSKKNWKPHKWKKWDAKFENNSKKENQTEGAKVPYKTCDELHYGACWFKGKPKRYKCDRFGHVAKDYRGKPAQTTNYATHKEEEGTMFYAYHSAIVVKNNDAWYVDSARSNHMTSHESFLINVDTKVIAKVKMGTRDLVQATGKVVEIFDDSSKEHLVAKIPMTGNRCFPFSLKYVSSVAMKAIVEESTWCWHRRENLPRLCNEEST